MPTARRLKHARAVIMAINVFQLNSIIYYLCAEPTATRPIAQQIADTRNAMEESTGKTIIKQRDKQMTGKTTNYNINSNKIIIIIMERNVIIKLMIIIIIIILLRIMSSGKLRRMALVRTDLSEELTPSFIRVTRIGEVETTLAVTSNILTLRRNTK
jgi:hypothetical protein